MLEKIANLFLIAMLLFLAFVLGMWQGVKIMMER